MFSKGLSLLTILLAYDFAVLGDETVIDLQVLLTNISTTLGEVRATHSKLLTTLSEVKATQSMVSTALNKFSEKCEDTCSKPPEPTFFKDCAEIWKSGVRSSGVYRIQPVAWKPIESFEVYCDMTTDGGGWTVFQKRGQYGNPADYFYRDWNDYREGFGDLQKEFWLGNEKIFALTNQNHDSYQLRIDLWDTDGNRIQAKYSYFRIESESRQYRLRINGFRGEDGDSMAFSKDTMFTTKDRDNDARSDNCAIFRRGAWWYNSCTYANLNGLNQMEEDNQQGIWWYTFESKYNPLAGTEMKIRPAMF